MSETAGPCLRLQGDTSVGQDPELNYKQRTDLYEVGNSRPVAASSRWHQRRTRSWINIILMSRHWCAGVTVGRGERISSHEAEWRHGEGDDAGTQGGVPTLRTRRYVTSSTQGGVPTLRTRRYVTSSTQGGVPTLRTRRYITSSTQGGVPTLRARRYVTSSGILHSSSETSSEERRS